MSPQNYFRIVRVASLFVFFSCMGMVGWSLGVNDRGLSLVVNSFLAGCSLIAFSTNNIIMKLVTAVNQLDAINRELLATNRHMVEVNRQMQAVLPEQMHPIDKPMGRMH